MVFSRFRLKVILRILALSATLATAIALALKTDLVVTIFALGVVIIVQIADLIRFVERTRLQLAQFFNSIKYEDFATLSRSRDERKNDELTAVFERVLEDFRRVRGQREEQYQYVQTIVQHINIGLLTYDAQGAVELMNSAAQRLLQTPRLKNIRDLELSPDLVAALLALKAGERKVIRIRRGRETWQLALDATEFRRADRLFTLASIQDIHAELEEQEMEAWQNLIRVLTHEIRNSIAPITSLSGTARELLANECQDEARTREQVQEDVEDVRVAVETIHKRSQGLLKFVESFRQLYQIPKPAFEIIPIADLFDSLRTFFNQDLDRHGIEARFEIEPETLELTADRGLIEQVLINLILNSIAALGDCVARPRLTVEARQSERGRVEISVTDNGPGLDEEALSKVFIPFYSTKKEGSGIGLSLSRQIMRLHQGEIQAVSTPNESTTFILRF